MRQGFNPYKDQLLENSGAIFHVVIPVFIPNQEGYFSQSFEILKLCLQSLFATCQYATKITVVNNGSCLEISAYLQDLFAENKIQELLQTDNIGKLNAIVKGITGNQIPLVTISDSDVLFLQNWQQETINVFNAFPKTSVVGLTPQFKMFDDCTNVIFDTFFSKNLQFKTPANSDAMVKFYDSLGWDHNYNPNYLHYILTLNNKDITACVGSGHFVATYKTSLFEKLPSYFKAKMGANSESFLDEIAAKHNSWKLTTFSNFAYHLGNVPEKWMHEIDFSKVEHKPQLVDFKQKSKESTWCFLLKNKIFRKLFKYNFVRKYFYKLKGLPKKAIQNY